MTLVFEVVRLRKGDDAPVKVGGPAGLDVVGAVPGRGDVLAERPNLNALAIADVEADGGEDRALVSARGDADADGVVAVKLTAERPGDTGAVSGLFASFLDKKFGVDGLGNEGGWMSSGLKLLLPRGDEGAGLLPRLAFESILKFALVGDSGVAGNGTVGEESGGEGGTRGSGLEGGGLGGGISYFPNAFGLTGDELTFARPADDMDGEGGRGVGDVEAKIILRYSAWDRHDRQKRLDIPADPLSLDLSELGVAGVTSTVRS